MNKIFNFQFPISIFNKLRFFLAKPRTVIIVGQEKEAIKETIFQILKQHFKIGKEVFIFETNEREINKFIFFFKNSRLPILVINDPNQAFSIKNLPSNVHFVLDYDNEKVKEINNFDSLKIVKFGFGWGNDIFVSDIKENGGTNFKINHKGSIVPFWFKEKLDKKEISIVLSAISTGIILGLNLVEISQSFREK